MSEVTRRTVLATTAFVPLAALTAAAQETALTPAQMKTLEAFIDRIVPKDDLGPGAVECGAAVYIDRTLATVNANEKPSFVEGLANVDTLAQTQHKASFADLSPEQRDELLTSIQNTPFFARVRRLTLEGMFSDPYYGGNKNFAGWDLIRYPGPRLAVSAEEQKMSAPPKPYRRSAYGSGSSNGH